MCALLAQVFVFSFGHQPPEAMFQRGLGSAASSSTDPDVIFQDDVEDLFAENVISAARATMLLSKAKDAGVKVAIKVIKQLPGVKKKWLKNASRKLRTSIRRDDKWPEP